MNCTLKLKGLSCRTPDRVLFRDVSLSLTHRDKIAVVGANGAGKTTLLKAIVGLSEPCEGHIEVNHNTLKSEKDFVQARREIGFMFQDPDDQIIAPTVIEEVAFGLLNSGMKINEAVHMSEQILEELNISRLRDMVTIKLSGGEKKLVALASILVMNPSILLLDEPSAALDADSENKISDILRNISKTMLIVSHDLGFIEKTGARKMFLSEEGLKEG